MPDHLRRVRPASRGGRWLAAAAGVAMVVGLVMAQSARAGSTATVDGGTLTPGTQATATFAAAGDVETFSILVPTGRRLTLTVADSAAPVQVGVTGFTLDGGGSGHPVTAVSPTIGNAPGAVRFEEFSGYPLDQHVTITMTAKGAGSLPFTPALVTDAAAVPIALDTPTTVKIGRAHV